MLHEAGPNVALSLAPLWRLTDETGLFEHAWHAIARRGNGYCTDDNGRALAIVSSIGGPGADELATTYLTFLHHAHIEGGRFHLRLGYNRQWTDDPVSDDANGRALFGLGVASDRGPTATVRRNALALFETACAFRSPYWRATAHMVAGASAVLNSHPHHLGAARLLEDARTALPRPQRDESWRWPEPRMGYEAARLPLALMHVGRALEDPELVADGLELLDWLIALVDGGDKLSLTPVAGCGPDTSGPGFDQQPVEAWAIADAALQAMRLAPSDVHGRTVALANAWFDGANDVGATMVDADTGGAYDGLEADGVNLNQGGESLLALLGTRLAAAEVSAAETAAVRA